LVNNLSSGLATFTLVVEINAGFNGGSTRCNPFLKEFFEGLDLRMCKYVVSGLAADPAGA
jgi:hypothetical protein